jgi:hypothetical protein
VDKRKGVEWSDVAAVGRPLSKRRGGGIGECVL